MVPLSIYKGLDHGIRLTEPRRMNTSPPPINASHMHAEYFRLRRKMEEVKFSKKRKKEKKNSRLSMCGDGVVLYYHTGYDVAHGDANHDVIDVGR